MDAALLLRRVQERTMLDAAVENLNLSLSKGEVFRPRHRP